MPSGLLKIAGLPLDQDLLDTQAQLKDENLVQTLKSALKPKKKPAAKAEPAKESAPAAKA